jgi:prepilin-type N-terminal cleavage/methylation domain-containing protein
MKGLSIKRGYTLMEMMLVVAIMGVLILAAPRTFIKTYQFVQLLTARVEIQKNARGALANINRDLRQALGDTIEVDELAGQPPHSRIKFKKYNSSGGQAWVFYYQQGTQLYQAAGDADGNILAGKLIANNLRYIAFTYPRTDDDGIISISITFEKATYEGGTKALQMAVEKVRIMN